MLNWTNRRLKFFGDSFSAEQAVERFFHIYAVDEPPMRAVQRKKLDLCGYEVWLITGDPPVGGQYGGSGMAWQKLADLQAAWRVVRGEEMTDMTAQEHAWAAIEGIGEVLYSNPQMVLSPLLRRFKESPTGSDFFILLTGQDPDGLPGYELNYLCNLWQLEQGFLPLHTAGVVQRGKLLLFGGPSGAGKSTVTRLSEEMGAQALDEDQVVVRRSADGHFSANAWGYSLATCEAPLRGVFRLVQDNAERLIALTQPQVAQFLLERTLDVFGGMLSDEGMENAFHQAAAIARGVPGYELHFRKSPDFWKLIDEQFPA